jgi:hypothetical protein
LHFCDKIPVTNILKEGKVYFCLLSLGFITSGSVSRESEHHGKEYVVDQSVSPCNGQEADTVRKEEAGDKMSPSM